MSDRDPIIEKYLNGDLEGEELTLFEKEYADDPELRQQVEISRAAIAGIQQVGRELEKTEMAEWEDELKSTGKVRKLEVALWYKVAAAIIILAIPTYLFLMPSNPYDEFYAPFPNYIAPTERGEDASNDQKQNGLVFYENGNYQKAIESFDQYLTLLSDDGDIVLYLGLSYQALGEHATAIPHLRRSLEIGTEYDLAAKWYLALSLLADDQSEYSRRILNDLALTTSSFGEKATALLDELD